MTQERNAFKAGIFIIISLLLIIAIVVGIKGLGQFLQPTQNASVTFTLADDIGGLAVGDDVRIGGAKVGMVRSIEFVTDADGNPAIGVTFNIPKRFVLHQNAVVSIQSTVTGVSVLNFSNLGTGDPLASGAQLTGHPGALTELLASGPDLMAAIHDVRTQTLPRVNNAVDKAADTLGVYSETGHTATDFIKYVHGKIDPILERYYAVADAAKTAAQNVGDLFGDTKTDFRTTVANLRDATGTVKDRLPGLVDKVDGLLTKVTSAVDDTSVALQDVKKIAVNTKDVTASVRSIIVTNRSKIEAMIASLKITGDNLKNASAEVRRSPWRLLYTPKEGEMANLNLYDSARQFADGAGQLNDAASALRDALKDPQTDPGQVQKLVEKLDKSFENFSDVEADLWKQVKQ